MANTLRTCCVTAIPHRSSCYMIVVVSSLVRADSYCRLAHIKFGVVTIGRPGARVSSVAKYARYSQWGERQCLVYAEGTHTKDSAGHVSTVARSCKSRNMESCHNLHEK